MKTRFDSAQQEQIILNLNLADTNPTLYDRQFRENHCYITINKAVSHFNVYGTLRAKGLTIGSAGDISFNAELKKTISVVIKAQNIILEKKIDSTLLFLEAERTMTGKVRQTGQVLCDIKAAKIINRHFIEAEHIDTTISNSVDNAGTFRAMCHGTIKTPRLKNTGRILSDKKLKIESKQILLEKKSRLIAKGESTVQASDSMTIEGVTKLEHSDIRVANQLRVNGQLFLTQKSSLWANKIDLKGNCSLQASNVEASLVTVGPEAKLSGSMQSTWHINSLLNNGTFDFNQGSLCANRFSNNGVTDIHHSSLQGQDYISNSELAITYSTLNTNRMRLTGPYQLIKSVINTKDYHQCGNEGSLIHSVLRAEHFQLDDGAKFKLEHSNLQTSFSQFNGNMSVNESVINGRVITQQHGTLRLENHTQLCASNTFNAAHDSHLLMKNGAILDTPLAWVAGELDVDKSVLLGNDIVIK
jgi:hypothetical protein